MENSAFDGFYSQPAQPECTLDLKIGSAKPTVVDYIGYIFIDLRITRKYSDVSSIYSYEKDKIFVTSSNEFMDSIAVLHLVKQITFQIKRLLQKKKKNYLL